MNQKIRQVSLFDPPEEPRDETQKETTAPISSVGADEGQPSTLNTNSIAQNVDPVTGFTIIFQGNADPVGLSFRIPDYLEANGLFCGWKYEDRNGMKTKVPYDLRNGERARSNDPDCFQHLSDIKQNFGCDGLGIGIFSGICAIDIDHCVLDNGTLTDTAADVVRIMHSYTEYSPSSKGIHILFAATGFLYDVSRYYIMNRPAGLEVYVSGATSKYVTITGNCLGSQENFGERSDELQQVLDKYMCRKPVDEKPAVNAINAVNPACGSSGQDDLPIDDDRLIEIALGSRTGEQFRRLWNGDTSGYPSHSEADMALCTRLAFWTAKDPAQMDRLFRRSGLMRDKWDRSQSGSTYGDITINHAIDRCTELYTPRTEPPKPIALPKAEPVFEEIIPLKPAYAALPPFPVDALPKAIADYVRAVSENTQTAPDMAAVIALGVLAIAMQGKYEVMTDSGWKEQLSLLTTVIASPGERKSPVMKLMTRCIEDYEQQYNLSLAPEIRRSKQKREADERHANSLKKELEHHYDAMKELELQNLEDQMAEETPITQARFTADDCTSEALTSLMAQNHERIGVISAEGGIFDILAGRYNNRVNLDIWLKGWSGDMLRVDRLGRESQYLRNPCLSACFAIQPSVLAEIMDNPVMNGRGLIARFLFSSPPSRVGTRNFFTPTIPESAAIAYREMVFRLMDLPIGEAPQVIRLTGAAAVLFNQHFIENEQFMLHEGQSIPEWSNKYMGTVMRIAGMITIAENAGPDISPELIERAFRIGRYFQAHTLYAYSQIGSDISQQKAFFVLNQLKKNAAPVMKRQELFQLCRGRFFKKTEDIFPTLSLLEEHGYIIQEQPQRAGSGRPPDVRIHVNPQAQAESPSVHPQAEFTAFNAFTA